ncbi:MAG: sterol desaturase family protein [Betaproteobacteria bacterium]|nr:sterol desaturase family protein [Betaproteobacteria bacterium]
MPPLSLSATIDHHYQPLHQRVLRFGLFPAFLTLAAAGSAAIHLAILPPMAIQMGVFLLAAIAVALAERYLPHNAQWRDVPPAERRVDVMSWAALMMVFDPLVKGGLLPLLLSLTVTAAHPQGGLGWFPTHWPVAVQLALAAVIAEFGQYWMHRLAHRGGWMWRVHGMHHSPERIYLLNGFRVNPINLAWHQLAGLFVLMLIGVPGEVLQMLILANMVVTVFQHANADLDYTGWNRLFSTADLHRWHHAAGPGAPHANFGSTLFLWDQVFGTYHRPGREPERVGIDGYDAPRGGYFAWLVRTTRG